ncbi:MAG: IucA/IucC family protein [Clostridia bacterium]|nr:IucA/IucC family protein [Clostridia bacterium]
MKLESIIKDPIASLNYMERLANNGSPSGFTEINTSSDKTNPFKANGFYLKMLIGGELKTYGEPPEDLCALNGLLVHPDWENVIERKDLLQDTPLYVMPTSSFRTVKVFDSDYYIKPSYPGVIGRMRRDLEEKHILSSIQLTRILEALVCNEKVNEFFAFLPESSGRLITLGNGGSTGYVVRGATPIG